MLLMLGNRTGWIKLYPALTQMVPDGRFRGAVGGRMKPRRRTPLFPLSKVGCYETRMLGCGNFDIRGEPRVFSGVSHV
jgi:hypothetical protein